MFLSNSLSFDENLFLENFFTGMNSKILIFDLSEVADENYKLNKANLKFYIESQVLCESGLETFLKLYQISRENG